MLNINPEIVSQIISRAKGFQAKEAVSFSEDLPDTEYEYDWSQVLADHKDDLTFQEVNQVIQDLEIDQKIDLLAIFYLGREDFDSLEEARKFSRENIQPHLAKYLFSRPLVSDFLERGLKLLGYSYE